MSDYTRPPATSANATWFGVGVYEYPDATQADATWLPEDRVIITGELLATTPPVVPPVTFSAALDYIQAVTLATPIPLAVEIPGITLTAEMIQDTALVQDVDGPRVGAVHAHGQRTTRVIGVPWQHGDHIAIAAALHHAAGDPIRVAAAFAHTHGVRIRRPTTFHHAHGLKVQAHTDARHAHGKRVRRGRQDRWAHGLKVKAHTDARHAETLRPRNRLRSDQAEAQPTANRLSTGWHEGWRTATRLYLSWTQMIWPEPGRWWPFYEPPGLHLVIPCDGDYMPRPLHCTVLLHWEPIEQPYCEGFDPEPPGPPGQIVVPILRIYVVSNSFSLVRVDSGDPLHAVDFTAAIDADSWTWRWSARIPGDQIALVEPDGAPVELLATVNDQPIRLVVEGLVRERRFSGHWLRLSGRGRAALLSAPYAPVVARTNGTDQTAQQLLNAALTVNNVSIGWTLDWGLEDWLVPAGIWSHTGTHIEAAIRIAEAVGGYVQGHDTDAVLKLQPYYPVTPWAFASTSAAIVLPEDVVEVEGIDWRDKPAYNQVWVTGQAGGIQGNVTRAGSAGNHPAPGVVDPLVTVTAAARQRGIRILGDTGRQAWVSLRLPVLAETGIIAPGQLIEYQAMGQTFRGLSRGVSVTPERAGTWQTVEIETHESV